MTAVGSPLIMSHSGQGSFGQPTPRFLKSTVCRREARQARRDPMASSIQPSMDHLDELEAQSIYILREGFARLKKLALLWSLGKDSNVMIWLARKAFFG